MSKTNLSSPKNIISQGQTGGVWGSAGATYYEIHFNK